MSIRKVKNPKSGNRLFIAYPSNSLFYEPKNQLSVMSINDESTEIEVKRSKLIRSELKS